MNPKIAAIARTNEVQLSETLRAAAHICRTDPNMSVPTALVVLGGLEDVLAAQTEFRANLSASYLTPVYWEMINGLKLLHTELEKRCAGAIQAEDEAGTVGV